MKIKKKTQLPNEKTNVFLYNSMKESILEGWLYPGQPISEEFVKNYFSISRTVVRETFIKLSKENLISVIPQKGTYVTLIDLKQIKDFLFLRMISEKEIYKLALENFDLEKIPELESNLEFQKGLLKINQDSPRLIKLDNDFHQIIFDGCDKSAVWNMLEPYQLQYDRLRILSLKEGLTQNKMLDQHIKLYEALKDKNLSVIKTILSNHLDNLEDLYGEIILKYPNYFINCEYFHEKNR